MNDDTLCKVHAIRRAHANATANTGVNDRRAIDAAVFTAELTALCAREAETAREVLALRALRVVREPKLYAAIERAILLASCQCPFDAPHDGASITRALALGTWAFVSAGDSVLNAVVAVIRSGGDSEGAGALVGGWLSVLHGPIARTGETQAA